MSTAVAKTETKSPTEIAKIPDSQATQLDEIDNMLKGYQHQIAKPELGTLTRMMMQARMIAALDAALTDEMMRDVMWLMNSPLGFKTDKTVSPFYEPHIVKRVLIQAWMNHAKAVGNEFNIIAGNLYLTKEFFRPAILRWPGLTEFVFEIGTAQKFGEKTAVMDARASWLINGEEMTIECVKTDRFDGRIVVNAFATSSPDELRGKGEAKLFRRVMQRLTGMNYGETGEIDSDASNTIDAAPKASAAPKSITAPVSRPAETESVSPAVDAAAAAGVIDAKKLEHAEAARNVIQSFVSDAAKANQVIRVQEMAADRKALIDSAEWSDELKVQAKIEIDTAEDSRLIEIRDNRGEKSNAKK